MKKLFLLAMVLFFGFALSPVYASGYVANDGVFIGLASEPAMTANHIPLGVQQLGTFMEALLAVGIGLLVYVPLKLLATGPATNAPERYDKRVVSSLAVKVRKRFAKLTKSPVLK